MISGGEGHLGEGSKVLPGLDYWSAGGRIGRSTDKSPRDPAIGVSSLLL